MFQRVAMYVRSRRSLGRRGIGIIHVGANHGQERDRYAKHKRPVVWIEADPSLMDRLTDHLACFPDQVCIEALVSDVGGQQVDFHIASNGGGSSSMLQMGEHSKMFPNVRYEKTIQLTTSTLPEVLELNGVDLSLYDVLMLDTQGSELKILRGALDILDGFRFVQVEVPDFESYVGCVQRDELVEFMNAHGFKVFISECFEKQEGVGSYYDITFAR